MAHTPGPWTIHRHNLKNGGRAVSSSDGKDPVADVYSFAADDAHSGDPGFQALRARCEANARLIAAAPDLLAALCFIDREMGNASSQGTSSRPTVKTLNAMWDAARAAIAKAKGETP